MGLGSYIQAVSRVAPAELTPRDPAVTPSTRNPPLHARVRPYRPGNYGDTVGTARRRGATLAQSGAGSRPTEDRVADWAPPHKVIDPGGEEYNDEPFRPPGTALAIHPDT